jgi:hypothetical protein
MKHLVVKVKNKDLFFNADEGMGEYVCSIPMLLDKEQADSIMKHCQEIYDIDTDDVYTNQDLEVREVELKYV